jgi:hypothetical protein
VSRDAVGWCERYPLISLRPDPNSNPDANPHLAGAECRHPTGREKMGSPSLQTHQYPILLLPWLWNTKPGRCCQRQKCAERSPTFTATDAKTVAYRRRGIPRTDSRR